MIEQLIVMVLLIILIVVTFGIIYLKDLLAAVILSGLYSLIAALIFVVMDAVDVAFTEAAVGAGISTIILLGALSFTRREQKAQKHNNIPAMIIVCATGALLIYGTFDMPGYGDGSSPANKNPDLAQYYIKESKHDTHVPNVVTSVLASYRGYDTLGETAVVFTAGLGVLSLLGLRRRKRDEAPKLSARQRRRQQNESES
jgi:multicomponent Na+:H+ antiporter subunit B